MSDYDAWRLENNENEDFYCDKCSEKATEHSSSLGMGKFEIVCDKCSEDMQFCDSCCRVGEEEDFSYGSEECDDCCDFKEDKMSDND